MAFSRTTKLACLGTVLTFFVGCSQHNFETGYHDFNKVQLQFYAPTGSTVTMGKYVCGDIKADRSHQINIYGDPSTRLEHEPEETATFNLAPGEYEFKYTGIPGWEGAAVYGNIHVYDVCGLFNPGTKMMLRKCFIPVALPSPATPGMVTPKDDIFPYASPSHRLRISYQDVERITAGDMVTKVIFVADLTKAKHDVDQLEVEYTCMVGKQQRYRALLCEAQLDALDDPASKDFIKIQCELKELEQKINRNRDRYCRLQSLLKADNVLLRREMMVLATDEILPAHEDPVKAAQELGQVVVVLRLGGRHNHWGNPSQETPVYLP